MKTAEQVLAEVAKYLDNPSGLLKYADMKSLTAPYLPKPEPDRLTLAAREICERYTRSSPELYRGGRYDNDMNMKAARAIIAREVEAAEPSDDALRWFGEHTNLELTHSRWDDEQVWRVHAVNGGRNDQEWKLIGKGQSPLDAITAARAALKGE